jgi:hypothetical protein
VDGDDEAFMAQMYGAAEGGSLYDPAADLIRDAVIDYRDLALFGAAFGASGGDPDATAPSLAVSLNDIPDDMNDLLVVPPDGFQITLLFDSGGGSVIDPQSLSVTSSLSIGPYAAGSELAPLFEATPTRAAWQIPAGSDLARTSHYLTVSIRDAAQNLALDTYGFAVRDFKFGSPMGGGLQTIFLDFTRDRSLTPEIDFLEDLRGYGLSSSADPQLEASVRDRVVSEILARAHPFFDRYPDGSPGADPVNLVFTDIDPGLGQRSRICVGGESALGASYLGASDLDENNQNKASDDCLFGAPNFGVFPQAIDNLWGSDADYHAAFDPLDPDEGGTAVGDDPLDAIVLDPAFDPDGASPEELIRWYLIDNAIDAFSQLLASVITHETGHLLGLVAHGPTPGGLFGGDEGALADHNVSAAGGTPDANFLMNVGGSFSFNEMTGRGDSPLPVFRALNWAYLHDRIAPNPNVTELLPPPEIHSVSPNPAVPNPQLEVTVHGAHFVSPVSVRFLREGDPTPNLLLSPVLVDSGTITGTITTYTVPPALYDVEVISGDDQSAMLSEGLLVQ